MERRRDPARPFGIEEAAAVAGDPELRAEEGLRRGRAKTDDALRLDQSQLRLEPGPAGLDLAERGLLMDALLAARLPLEVLHRIGDEGFVTRDTYFSERFIENPTGRPDEGPAGKVFLISGLLADEEERRLARAFSKHRLSTRLIEIAGAARLRSLPRVPRLRSL